MLLVWGERDHALGLGLTRGLELLAPAAQLAVVRGCSHWVQQDDVEEAHTLLARWLQETAHAGSTAACAAAKL